MQVHWDILVKEAANKDYKSFQKRESKQTEHQKFYIYGDSLKKHFSVKFEKKRALYYVVKLSPSLRQRISKVALIVPSPTS